ncbi:histidine kinase [Flavobacterium sp. Fl-77]|uniref:Histidine kinase n=1 Tax=Flavobacterium flavipigmentatum TaxID=2893884 RepID=A0AAJ2SFP8_9FLAO|nr:MULTISPECIES: histidine kinase [unclassified Flavobacterium]MDX6181527.1 histidine kinase [Flavobacterium sp. Fl-33]MDX6185439.1 histidine kinase [Flavobacterium sp. Fl-77]UFH37542.1 histidine kinase [Flavobacterium sp. F-70]
MLKKKKYIFVLVQIIIWTIYSGVNIIPAIIFPKFNVLGYKNWQLLLDFFFSVCFLTAVSMVLKFVYDRYIKLDDFKFWEIIKMLFLVFTSAMLYYGVIIAYNYFMLYYIYQRPEVFDHPTQSAKKQVLFIFVMGFLFFLWIIVYTIYKTTSQIKNNKMDRMEIENNLKDSQLNALKGQINPHFMFNSLNNIRGLILENPEKSREMITRLSEMLRYSLTKNDITKIALEEEIEMVENFIEISKIQLEERLNFTSEIEKNTLKLEIPPMIIQMLIENAVKHGIAKLKDGGQISLQTKLENNSLLIFVSNTGMLTIEKDSTQLGIKNIEKRLQLIYGENASFKLQEIKNEVIAKIIIPIL